MAVKKKVSAPKMSPQMGKNPMMDFSQMQSQIKKVHGINKKK